MITKGLNLAIFELATNVVSSEESCPKRAMYSKKNVVIKTPAIAPNNFIPTNISGLHLASPIYIPLQAIPPYLLTQVMITYTDSVNTPFLRH